MTIIILHAKDKILVAIDTYDYNPCNRLGQLAKDNRSQKINPCGISNHASSHISFATKYTTT
jgi:hypothetical protein